jgi:hypothetical protein
MANILQVDLEALKSDASTWEDIARKLATVRVNIVYTVMADCDLFKDSGSFFDTYVAARDKIDSLMDQANVVTTAAAKAIRSAEEAYRTADEEARDAARTLNRSLDGGNP